jgi:hypothetical protein
MIGSSSANDTVERLALALNSSADTVEPSQPIDLVLLKGDSDLEVREASGCRMPDAGCRMPFQSVALNASLCTPCN